MSDVRKKPGWSGRRSVRAGAIFAALALAVSMSAVFSSSVASGHDDDCNGGTTAVSPDSWHHCFTITTNLDGAHIPLGNSVTDTATVTTGQQTSADSQGVCASDVNCTPPVKTASVTFAFFKTGECAGSPFTTETKDIDFPDPSSSVSSSPQSELPVGTYSYLATFNGSVGQWKFTAESECETFTIDPVQPVVNTVIQTDSLTVNGPFVHDVATVVGVAGLPPTGEVSFTFFHNGSCTPAGFSVSRDGLAGGSAESESVGPLAAGSYSFLAHYDPNGDTNYRATDGVCEPLVVNTMPEPGPPIVVAVPRVIFVQPAPQVIVQVSPATAVRSTAQVTG